MEDFSDRHTMLKMTQNADYADLSVSWWNTEFPSESNLAADQADRADRADQGGS
jgi:hypothetical protein